MLTGVQEAWQLENCNRCAISSMPIAVFAMRHTSHVFPWYVTALLSWIVLLLSSSYGQVVRSVFLTRVLTLTALWLFTVISLLGYIADWPTYYRLADDGLAGAVIGAGLLALFPYWFPLLWKGLVYVRPKRDRSS